MKVLIVEDDTLVREFAVAALHDAGFEVIEAATGEEALDRARAGPDAVLLDLRLPGRLSGWDVAKRLRQQKPDLPVVYASGAAPDPMLGVPGSRFLRKPYSPTQVIVAICEQVCGGSGISIYPCREGLHRRRAMIAARRDGELLE